MSDMIANAERRGFPRRTNPLQGAWQGASGGSECRIVDISWTGCFIQTLAQPAMGEHTLVTVHAPSGAVTLLGSVVYREPGMGFSVRFEKIKRDQYEVLKPVLGEPGPGEIED